LAWSEEVPRPPVRSFKRDYRLVHALGEGSCGRVFAATKVSVPVGPAFDMRSDDADGRWSLDRRRQQEARAEAAVLQRLATHENIVRFQDFYMDDVVAYLVMERCPYSLLDLLELEPALHEEMMRSFLQQMLVGICACHSSGVVHRDIKAGNFVATIGASSADFEIKLCDFGLATLLRHPDAEDLTGVHGTTPHMAPEMLTARRYSAKVDVWSMGVLAYVVLYGDWPYTAPAPSTMAMKSVIAAGVPAPRFHGPSEVSGRSSGWVRSLLQRCPRGRLTSRGALEALAAAPWDASASLRRAVARATQIGALSIGQVKAQPTRATSEVSTATPT